MSEAVARYPGTVQAVAGVAQTDSSRSKNER